MKHYLRGHFEDCRFICQLFLFSFCFHLFSVFASCLRVLYVDKLGVFEHGFIEATTLEHFVKWCVGSVWACLCLGNIVALVYMFWSSIVLGVYICL